MGYKNFNDLPEELQLDLYKGESMTFDKFKEVVVDEYECLGDYLRECSSICGNTEFDGDDMVTEYRIDTDEYRYYTYGREYVKDSCICEMQMDDVEVIRLIDIIEPEEMITITKSEYDKLLKIEQQWNLK